MTHVSPRKKRLVFLGLGLLVFALDQISKYPFRSSWYLGQSKPLTSFLALTYVKNTGSLAGMFSHHTVLLGLVSLLVSLGIIFYAWLLPKKSGWLPYVTLGILLGGATGNGWDRLVHGFVVDFFDIQWKGHNVWPVFNVADIAVDVSIALFILMAILEPRAVEEPAEDLNVDAPILDAEEDPQRQTD